MATMIEKILKQIRGLENAFIEYLMRRYPKKRLWNLAGDIPELGFGIAIIIGLFGGAFLVGAGRALEFNAQSGSLEFWIFATGLLLFLGAFAVGFLSFRVGEFFYCAWSFKAASSAEE